MKVEAGTGVPRGDRDLMSVCQHDGSISMETAHEFSQHPKTGPTDSRPGGAVALRAEPDGLKGTPGAIGVVAGKGNKDSRGDSGHSGGGFSDLADTLGEWEMSN